ncbi:hypothetical protein E2C01_091605 [Portunus trituberculatus]|uniref:Uncharacterized protein n=1 Tax=Portunus trituberculatus TaxID=210409 RepID=A0A5B7JTC3_PORTR|nr:hypothetical protein [Portunus trituberculatus]
MDTKVEETAGNMEETATKVELAAAKVEEMVAKVEEAAAKRESAVEVQYRQKDQAIVTVRLVITGHQVTAGVAYLQTSQSRLRASVLNCSITV